MKKVRVDTPFLISVFILVVAGYLIFASASLGLLSNQPLKYANVAFNQTFLGLFLGTLACIITSRIDYRLYRKYSPYLFGLSVIATLLVFMPHIGISHGGAKRWIYLGFASFQPSELLKICYIIFLSALLTKFKDKTGTFKYGLVPFLVLTSIIGIILLNQPDTDTLIITAVAGVAIYLTSGGKVHCDNGDFGSNRSWNCCV
jgi:cell division protein FtsW